MPRFISHPGSRKKRNTYKRSHKRGHNKRSGTRKQRGGRGGGGAGIAGASGHGALTTGASQVAAQLSPASYEDDD